MIEYDFVVVLVLITIMSTLTSHLVKFIVQQELGHNFMYYLLIICIVLISFYMVRQSLFPFDLGDENKILLLFCLKTFILSYMICGYFTHHIDFGLVPAMKKFQIQLNSLTSICTENPMLSPDLIFLWLSTVSSVLSITIVHLGIKNAYHFYFVNKSIELSQAQQDHENVRKLNKDRFMIAINFFTPILVFILYIPALSSSFVVPEIMNFETFELIRFGIIFVVIMLKASMFYNELQFEFNENYFYIQKLLSHKHEKLFKYIQLKMKLKFVNIWITCFQYMALVGLPLLFLLATMHKWVVLQYFPDPVQYDYSQFLKTIPQNGLVEVAEVSLYDAQFLNEAAKQITAKGFIPIEFEKAVLNYFIFSYHLSWFVVSSIGLVYYRKFKG